MNKNTFVDWSKLKPISSSPYPTCSATFMPPLYFYILYFPCYNKLFRISNNNQFFFNLDSPTFLMCVKCQYMILDTNKRETYLKSILAFVFVKCIYNDLLSKLFNGRTHWPPEHISSCLGLCTGRLGRCCGKRAILWGKQHDTHVHKVLVYMKNQNLPYKQYKYSMQVWQKRCHKRLQVVIHPSFRHSQHRSW